MNNVSILGHATNEKSPAFIFLKKHPKKWNIVFINNPTEPLPKWVNLLAKDVLHLQFDDIVFEGKKLLKAPSKEDISKALEWTKSKDNVLFSCHAGVSRSSAMAYVCACQEFHHEDAIKMLIPMEHYPNYRIVTLGSEIIKNKDMLEAFKQWLEKNEDNEI